MDATTLKALKLLRKIKSVTFSTISHGMPTARIIDVMFIDDDGLYFLTARGKSFYRELKSQPCVAICGMDDKYVSARLVGDVRFCNDKGIVDKIFILNPMMNDLYPGEKRYVLEGIHLYRGKGEIFDLSTVPPKRERFAFGGLTVNPSGYNITEQCSACGLCADACPAGIITEGDIFEIDRSRCLECGSCADICPDQAVEKAKGI